ncbi:hypothetical protein D3C78_1634420 [compost metagenome]
MSLSLLRTVYQYFFSGWLHSGFFITAVESIVFAFFETRVIPIAFFLIRNTLVILLNAAFHFLEKLFLQICCRSHHRFGISIFGIQIIQNRFRLSIRVFSVFLLIG